MKPVSPQQALGDPPQQHPGLTALQSDRTSPGGRRGCPVPQRGLPSVTPDEKPLLTAFHCGRMYINRHG